MRRWRDVPLLCALAASFLSCHLPGAGQSPAQPERKGQMITFVDDKLPEVGQGKVSEESLKLGSPLSASYALTLMEDASPEPGSSWAGLFICKGAWKPGGERVLSSGPARVEFHGKPKGSKVDVALRIDGKDTKGLTPGVYSAYAYGEAPREFLRKLGELRIGSGGEPPSGTFPVDISSACDMGFKDDVAGDRSGGWTDQGQNDLREIPIGLQNFRGVPFKIIDPASNGGKSCIVLKGERRPYFPASAEISPIDRTAAWIYFLHACAWCPPAGEIVAEYAVEYADGSKERIPVRSGLEIGDWWSIKDAKSCVVGWSGKNNSSLVGVGIFPWRNPHPERPIRKIAFESKGTSVPAIVAATLSDRELAIEERSRDGELSATATAGWFPFEIPSGPPAGTAIDMSWLLDKPAGKHGFCKAKDGRFVFEDGTKGRFWGVVVGGDSAFLSHKRAEMLAQRLAEMGCNLVRLHNLEANYAMPNIFSFSYAERAGLKDTQRLSEKSLDRLDYFISQLKNRGIYVYLDLFVGRHFLPGDNAPGLESGCKIVRLFDPRVIELERAYAKALLTHFNPYAKAKYVDEPAIMGMDICNEESLLFEKWFGMFVKGPYLKEHLALWNKWLLDKHGSRQRLKEAWAGLSGKSELEDGESPESGTVARPAYFRVVEGSGKAARTRDWNEFSYEMQKKYFVETAAFLRGLGVKVPIAGSNHPTNHAGDVKSNAALDVIDRHFYWDHPQGGMGVGATVRNTPMVRNPGFDVGSVMSSCRIQGKPLLISEWTECFPNEYRVEAQLIVPAIASLQDWDAATQFCFLTPEWERMMGRHGGGNFAFCDDPVIVGLWRMASLMFLREDVAPAKREHVFDVPDSALKDGKDIGYKIPAGLPCVSKVSNKFVSGEAKKPEAPAVDRSQALVSDTGQLKWDERQGIFSINAPRTQGAAGFLGGKAVDLDNLSVKSATKFCTVVLSSLDRAPTPLPESGRLLLVAAARSENAGMLFDSTRTVLARMGRPPILIEPMEAELALKLDAGAKGAEVFALDFGGARKMAVPSKFENGILSFKPGREFKTIYYEICVKKAGQAPGKGEEKPRPSWLRSCWDSLF